MIDNPALRPPTCTIRYTRDKDAYLKFYKKYYSEFIDADVMYQDYLEKIDKRLRDGLRRNGNHLPTLYDRNDKLYRNINTIDKGRMRIGKLRE